MASRQGFKGQISARTIRVVGKIDSMTVSAPRPSKVGGAEANHRRKSGHSCAAKSSEYGADMKTAQLLLVIPLVALVASGQDCKPDDFASFAQLKDSVRRF